MPEKFFISNPTRNLIIAVLLFIYLGFCGLSLYLGRSEVGRPFPGFMLLRNNLVALLYFPDWEGFKRGIKFGDVVLAADHHPLTSPDALRRLLLDKPVGASITYDLQRGQQVLQLTVPVSVFEWKDYLLFFLLMDGIGLLYVLMGLVVFYLKPNSAASRALLWFGMVVAMHGPAIPSYCTNHLDFLFLSLYPLVGLSILIIGLYFPVEIKSRRTIMSVAAAVSAFVIFLHFYLFYSKWFLEVTALVVTHIVLCSVAGVGLMLRSFLTSTEARVRQQGKVVVIGFVVTFLTIFVGLIAFLISWKATIYFLFISIIPALAIPTSLGYAIAKHNLFDVDLFIRRSAGYLLVSGLMVALFFLLITLFSLALQQIAGSSSQIAAVLSTLLIVVMFQPLQARIDRAIDRRFFREKYEYTATLRKASQVLVSIIELEPLLRQLLDTVMDAIKIERGLILLREKDPDRFAVAAARGYERPEELEPLGAEHFLVRHLESEQKPVQLNDIQEREEFQSYRAPLLRLSQESGIILSVPMIYERRLLGILALGAKKSGAWYSSEDMELLQTLMIQTAVSIENARKVQELKKLVELETSYRELQKVDEMKDNFLSMVSHDLRTPMTSIKGYTSLMLEKLGRLEPERQGRYLTIIHHESDRLTRLITNLLEVQRFEAGRANLVLQEVDLRGVVEESVAAFQGAAIKKNLRLEQSLPDGPVVVEGDRDRLSQVLANLLSNAVKFTPEEGRVEVAMVEVKEDGKTLARVLVQDTGPGIAREMQGRLFSKFQQVDQLVRAKEQGSGLGLALVKEIISHHGGRVGMESEPGQGSRFWFSLPVKAG